MSSLPNSEPLLIEYALRFSTQLSALGTVYGFTTEQTNAVFTSVDNLRTLYGNHLTAQEGARTARVAKDQAKADTLELLRSAIRRLQAAPNMTDEVRQQFGITVPAPGPTPPPVPSTSPVGIIEFGERLQHVLKVVDSANPNARCKPEGVEGCEVWMKIGGEAPSDPSQLMLAGIHKNHRFTRTFAGAQAGQQAWYWLRWINTRGQTGPWSEPVSATIAA